MEYSVIVISGVPNTFMCESCTVYIYVHTTQCIVEWLAGAVGGEFVGNNWEPCFVNCFESFNS